MISLKRQKHENPFLHFGFGTTRAELKQLALTAKLHLYRATLKNEHVANGPKTHLARWSQTPVK